MNRESAETVVIVVGSSPALERTVHDLIIWKLLTRLVEERKTPTALFVHDRVIYKCVDGGQFCTLTLSQLPVQCL